MSHIYMLSRSTLHYTKHSEYFNVHSMLNNVHSLITHSIIFIQSINAFNTFCTQIMYNTYKTWANVIYNLYAEFI